MTNLTAVPELASTKALKSDAAISEALALIGDRYGAIVPVIDDDDRLCGVVSAGDLRKAILNGHGVDTPLRVVMNERPVTIAHDQLGNEASVNAVLAEFRRLYKAGMMYAMAPVTDGDGRVMGLIDLQSLALRASDPGLRATGFACALQQLLSPEWVPETATEAAPQVGRSFCQSSPRPAPTHLAAPGIPRDTRTRPTPKL